MIQLYSKEDMKKYTTRMGEDCGVIEYEFTENGKLADVVVCFDLKSEYYDNRKNNKTANFEFIRCHDITFSKECTFDFVEANDIHSYTKISIDNIVSFGTVTAETIECDNINCKNVFANTLVCDSIIATGFISVDMLSTRYIAEYNELSVKELVICGSVLPNVVSLKSNSQFNKLAW